jgi:hypothetical protein
MHLGNLLGSSLAIAAIAIASSVLEARDICKGVDRRTQASRGNFLLFFLRHSDGYRVHNHDTD